MNSGFDIEEIRSFVLLGENGSFTETAHALGISQSAVSQRIARLEHACGLQLFARTAERTSLTREGEVFLQSARRCVHEHHTMVAHIGQFCRASQGRVRMWIDSSLLGEKLARQVATLPPDGVAIDCVQSRNGQDWQAQLSEFDCDLAVAGRFLQADSSSSTFSSILLCQEAGITAMWAEDHFKIDASVFDFSSALRMPLIVPSPRLIAGFHGFVEDWCKRAYGSAPREVIEFDTFASMLNACRAGLGICLVPGDTLSAMDLQTSRLSGKRLFMDVLPVAYACSLYLRADEENPLVLEAAQWVKRMWGA